VLSHDTGAEYVPLDVITWTCVTPLGAGLQISDNVSPGLSVIGSVKLLCCWPFRYAVHVHVPLGSRFMAVILMALTPIAFMSTVSTPPNSSAETASALLADIDGITPRAMIKIMTTAMTTAITATTYHSMLVSPLSSPVS